MDFKLLAQLVAGCCLAGCVFDSTGVPSDDDLPDAGPPDDTMVTPDGGDGGGDDAMPACAMPFVPAVTVNGVEVPLESTGTVPTVDVLLGDLVEVDASGSCSQAGTITFAWEILPSDQTAEQDPAAPIVRFYPEQATDDYRVLVTIGDGEENEITSEVRIDAHGWTAISGTTVDETEVTNIHDLAVSDGELWVAANDAPFRLPLEGPQDGMFVALNSQLIDNSVGGTLRAVHYQDNQVWFGSDQSLSYLWRIHLGSPPATSPVLTTEPFGITDAIGGSAKVRDIAALETSGILVATSTGVTRAEDGISFAGDIEPNGDEDIRAVATGGGRIWGGSRKLYDLDAPDATPLEPFSNSNADDKIRALVVDAANNKLWVGSDDQGIALLNNSMGTMDEVYTVDNSGLATNKIRALRVETTGRYAGDVWAATDKGVARYVSARDVWITMGDNEGLSGHLDVRAIAIDEAEGRRAIYAGTSSGVVYIRPL